MRIACAVWLVAAVWSSFPLFGWGEYVPEPYGLSCTIAWRGYHTSAKDAFYVICSFACFTLVPVVLIVVSQCRIIYKVSRFSDSLSARGIRNNLRYAEKRLSMVGEFKNKVVWPWNCFFFLLLLMTSRGRLHRWQKQVRFTEAYENIFTSYFIYCLSTEFYDLGL